MYGKRCIVLWPQDEGLARAISIPVIMEVTLCIVPKGIGEYCMRKHSLACQKLSGKVECATTIVTALQARMVMEHLRVRVEQIQKAKNFDKREDICDPTSEAKKQSWSLVVRDGYWAPGTAQM